MDSGSKVDVVGTLGIKNYWAFKREKLEILCEPSF